MIEWTNIERRLTALGKNRVWLAENTPYSPESIRQALAPKGSARSDRMQEILSRAIEDEEARQAQPAPRELRPGVFEIFQTDEQLHAADVASRIVGAPSIAAFCRDVICAAAERIIAEELDAPHPPAKPYPTTPIPGLRAAAPDPEE
jgi:hypothetical protein